MSNTSLLRRAPSRVAAVCALGALGAVPLATAHHVAGHSDRAAVVFTIDTATGHEAISPLIYGINADESVGSKSAFTSELSEVRPTLIRLGGNRWTAYNWENNDSNAGSDYEFENDDYLTASTSPAAAVLPTVRAAEAIGATALVTVPIAGYVAADRNPPGDVENSPDYLAKRFRIDEPDEPGGLTLEPDKKDRYVYQDQFVYFLHHEVPHARLMFSLDNEPDLWDSTHAEIHPLPTTYAEILKKDLEYAQAVKKVLPGALVTGPVSYGWEGYLSLQDAPDSAADGDFLDWYLAHVHAADEKAGYRIIDDLDLHWYPEATGGGVRITGTQTTPAVVAAREQAPRSLWQKSYVEDSWITEDSTGGKGIDLISRIDKEIAENDPGMNLDFSEWDYGGGQSISGAIATADVLGIFGRYGVHAAAWWPLAPDESFALGGFAIFRNYNGHGASFGDTEVTARTSSVSSSSVYASIDSADPSHSVIVVINKATVPSPAEIELSGLSASSAAVYRLTSASPRPARAPRLTAKTPGTFDYTMPAQSISVIVPSP